MPTSHSVPIGALAALLASAVVWGLIWYPYRLLRDAGIGGELATLLTYLVALMATLPMLGRADLRPSRPGLLLAIALAGAAANLGYVLALLEGRVMIVLLLFYLAPVWTVLLASWLLAERMTSPSVGLVLAAVMGAAIMLWKPDGQEIAPGPAEWLGLAAGFAFALCNVLLRRGRDLPLAQRSAALFTGVGLLAGLAWMLRRPAEAAPLPDAASVWGMIVFLGLVLMVANLVLQYGLARVPANRAIVILLLELPVAALAAYFLAGESMRWNDWLGGLLIVLSGIAAARRGATPDRQSTGREAEVSS